jgi:hypothetical protein
LYAEQEEVEEKALKINPSRRGSKINANPNEPVG